MKTEPNGLITRSESPVNLEMPFASLDTFLTPNERFYVRCHFPIPEIRVRDWRLKIEGAVAAPFELGLEELRQMPQRTMTTTIECAGNGRSFLEPKVKGVAWENGAVGNATWTGALLGDLLKRADPASSALEVILEGADRGEVAAEPRPSGEIQYARSLPVRKAMADVLLAWEMNGEALTRAHGFPLRAIVPGWFGMASVKWLQRIVVIETEFNGYYQSVDYAYWERRNHLPELKPLREMRVKAQIARPAVGEVVPANAPYRIRGAAWGESDEVAKVELSSDDGRTWREAQLLGEPVKHAWRFWEFAWQTPAQPGHYNLIARATDSAGRTQPKERVRDYGTYMINHWLRIPVQVR